MARQTFAYVALGPQQILVNFSSREITWRYGFVVDVFSDSLGLNSGSFEQGLSMVFRAILTSEPAYPISPAAEMDD